MADATFGRLLMIVRPTRLRYLLLTSAIVAAAGAALLGGVAASATPVHVASSVTVFSAKPAISGHRVEIVHLLRLNLNDKHLHLDVVLPHNTVGATRQTVQTLATQTHAIAGINADFFDINYRGAQPQGGVIRNGHVIKTPRSNWNANFYLTPDGRAHIGVAQFTATLTRAADPVPSRFAADPVPLRPAATERIFSINTLRDAQAGHLTLINRDLAAVSFGARCTVATATRAADGVSTVTSVSSNVTSLPRSGVGQLALAACGVGGPATWLANELVPGDVFRTHGVIAGGIPRMLVSGGSQLLRGGQLFDDTVGRHDTHSDPQSFACVSAKGLSVLFGVLDGRWKKSAGATYPQLARYLLGLHCYDAMTFDGGGSTTMVAKLPHHRATSVLNHPSDGKARHIADAILIYRS